MHVNRRNIFFGSSDSGLLTGFCDEAILMLKTPPLIKTSFAAGFFGSKKHLKIRPSSPNCKDTFPVPPIIANRRHPSLRGLLVHSTLYNNTPDTQQPAGVYKCNYPLCLTCPFLQEGQTNYIFTATNEQRKIINHLLNWLQIQKSYLLNLMQQI